MSSINLTQITSGYNVSKINSNFDIVATKINNDLFHLSDGNNTLQQDIDLNGNDLLNVDTVNVRQMFLNGNLVTSSVAVIGDDIIGTNNIKDKAVTSAKIDDEAITTGKIADGAVTADKLAEGVVDTQTIADGSVVSSKLADDAVTTSKIEDGAVTTAKLADSSVTSDKISGQLSGSILEDSSVTTSKIANSNITGPKIANSSIDQNKIANGSVITSKIADDAVTRDKIVDGAVSGEKIANLAINDAQVGSISASKVVNTLTAVGAIERRQNARNEDYRSVSDFGAVGDGLTNDTTAFNNAGECFVPSGKYIATVGSGIEGYWGPGIVREANGPYRGLEKSYDLYKRRVLFELPIRFPLYTTVLANKGYDYMFPQGLAVYEDRIYIIYGGTTGSSNSGAWVSVHSAIDGDYISGFDLNSSYSEGLVVRRESDDEVYLYARKNSGFARWKVTNLPTDGSTPSTDATYTSPIYTMMCGDDQHIALQIRTPFTNNDKNARNFFRKYDNSLSFIGNLEFDAEDLWNIDSGLIPYNIKAQGISTFKGGYAICYGGTFHIDDAEGPSNLCGLRIFSDTGRLIDSGLMHPKSCFETFQNAGYTIGLIEFEGLSEYNNALYGLWVTSSHTNTGPSGILITEETRGNLNFHHTRSNNSTISNLKSYEGKVMYSDDGIKNPITGETFTTLNQILQFMRDAHLSRLSLYTTNTPITDLNGNAIGSGRFVEIITGGYGVWEVTIKSASAITRFWANGAASPTQGDTQTIL